MRTKSSFELTAPTRSLKMTILEKSTTCTAKTASRRTRIKATRIKVGIFTSKISASTTTIQKFRLFRDLISVRNVYWIPYCPASY